ncbi:MAG: hypothetical protein JOZ77_08535 [Candidatus Eremiobacteraeota bacterium]|nr:hypothetical protein [Candidatus Eremiobacteraeota bacterium]
MAVVVFMRGVNVGGYRRFRPTAVAKELARYDVVNVGATGLFVVRNPGPVNKFRAELLRRLPFDTQVAICDARDVLELENGRFFDDQDEAPEIVRFVSVLVAPVKGRLPAMPFGIPHDDGWYVKVLGSHKAFVFGLYRRHIRTIAYLGKIDQALGVPVTTRKWNTIATVLKVLKA